ncbi:DNA polymerase Y family protein [Sphingomonas sp. RB56-2]|uniref:DNA polymerase Y family protein n=1 Tax=Sphingomonas brevis TaxID=2908206 RepID=A0ABT0SCQ4_9SPHN|nr:DNA polymerase Y family protein [Sphingomonas brevis]MCL6741861.1 DNA polymerase Y family protein [Sphingomonas brevis]
MLALCFPFLPADRLRRQPNCGLAPEVPLAFARKVKGALRLAAVDQAARSLGLEQGMALADARARVPLLEAVEQDEAADRAWLERLADGCIRYTPMVALDPPYGLILDVTGCSHLLGGEKGLATDVEARMATLRMTVRLAFADTPRAAHALARYQAVPAKDEAAAIRRLPVAALELAPDTTQGLLRAGLKTVGELARRPMSAIAARFGAEAVTALREMLGEAARPIEPRIPLAPILAERRFAEPVARTEYAIAVLGELAAEIGWQLEQRHEGGRRFEAFFFRSDGLVRLLVVETSQPNRDPALIIRLMNERIEGLNDPIDPGFGFDLIRLAVPATEPLALTQLSLEGGAAKEAKVAALIDQIATRLGRGRVQRFVARDTHIPEQMQLALPAVEIGEPSASWPQPAPGEPPLRPLHLFDPPQPIEVMALVPDGPPRRFRWRRKDHFIKRFEGPERIASEWWKRKDGAVDKAGLTRDYYRVEDARGRRFWVFRHGLFDEKPQPQWYLHGLFA